MTASKRKATPKPKPVQGFVRAERQVVTPEAASTWARVEAALAAHRHYTDAEKLVMRDYLRDAYDRFPLSFETTSTAYLFLGAGATARSRLKKEVN